MPAGLQCRLLETPGDEWAAVERQLVEARVPLHAYARAAWARNDRLAGHWLLAVETVAGQAVAAAGLHVHASRALPGHVIVRAARLNAPPPGDALHALAHGLADVARSRRRVLRLTAELARENGEILARAGEAFAGAGFAPQSTVRAWARTLVIDLTPSEEAILAGFSQKPRRDLRAAAKAPVAVRTVDDPRWLERIDALQRATRERTGGVSEPIDWPRRLAFARDVPDAGRLVGLFRTDRDDASALVAFVWALKHGDHATYETGGSERQDDIKVPLLTPLLWDVARWAKAGGAHWFDLGGVSAGTLASGDPLGGISDFKRLLSTDERLVGADWTIEPHRVRATVARMISRIAAR